LVSPVPHEAARRAIKPRGKRLFISKVDSV
jgi:hypothetical protein